MQFGVQLYTLRKFGKDESGIRNIFEFINKLNISVVQVSGLARIDAKVLNSIAKDNNVTISCTHSPFDMIKNNLDKLVEEHKTFGSDTIGLGVMPKEYQDNNFEKLDEFIELCNNVSNRLKKDNMKFAYHNHALEFKKVGDKKILDILFERVGDMQFILDTYWLHYAKQDILAYIDKFSGRLENIHLKDYRKILGITPVMCELGRGVIDFDSVIKAFEKAGTKYALIEQDISRHPYKSVEISWNYLQKYIK